MTIANKFASKLSVAFVAAAMIFSSFAATASAQTTEELQQMINDLLAQIAQLEASTSVSAGTGSCVSIMAPLTIGATGADVTALQNRLLADGEMIPAGATGYFGTQTQAALASWQGKNAVSPAVGYYGPITKAAMDASCTPATTPDDDDDDSSDDDDDFELRGEASLDSFEVDDADETDVEEGDEEVEIAEITIEFRDGDAEISRLDLSFVDGEGATSDPWDVFESFSLWVDGDMIAEEDADDEDYYLDEESEMRFSNLGVIAMEDEEVTIIVAATINNNLDAAELGEWDVKGVAMRFFDADGVATTETGSAITGDTATFNIEVEGAGDDLDLKASSNDPDQTTLALDDRKTTDYEVFVFELDADDSDGDITLEEVVIDLVLSSSTRDLDEVVKDVMIEIDGESFDADDFDGGSSTEAVAFDIDGEITIDAGESVEVTVIVEFEKMEGDSDLQGVTLTASVDTTDIDAEGESGEAVTLGGSDQSGEAHTLRSEGLVLEIDTDDIDETKKSASFQGDTDRGTYKFVFDVTAFGEDFFINENTDVVNYQLLVGGSAVNAASSSATLKISGATNAGTSDFKISEGETAVFTFTVETAADVSGGDVKVRINSVDYSAADDGTEELNVLATPTNDWTSGALILNN